MFFLFTFDSPAYPEIVRVQTKCLFPTPIWLRVTSSKSQLMKLGAVGEHHPEFLFARALGLKDNVGAIRRPRGIIVAPAVMRQLNPLLACDIHQVDIGRAGLAGTVLANPCQSKELAIRRPVGRDGISLVSHALLVGAVRLHGIDLRQSRAATDKSDVSAGLPIPDGADIRAFVGGKPAKVGAGCIRSEER